MAHFVVCGHAGVYRFAVLCLAKRRSMKTESISGLFLFSQLFFFLLPTSVLIRCIMLRSERLLNRMHSTVATTMRTTITSCDPEKYGLSDMRYGSCWARDRSARLWRLWTGTLATRWQSKSSRINRLFVHRHVLKSSFLRR